MKLVLQQNFINMTHPSHHFYNRCMTCVWAHILNKEDEHTRCLLYGGDEDFEHTCAMFKYKILNIKLI